MSFFNATPLILMCNQESKKKARVWSSIFHLSKMEQMNPLLKGGCDE